MATENIDLAVPSKKIQRNLNAALGKPPTSGNNHQSKASTGNIIGDNKNEIVSGNQPSNQPISISSDSPSINSHRQSHKPKMGTKQSSNKSNRKAKQPLYHRYSLRNQRRQTPDSLEMGLN